MGWVEGGDRFFDLFELYSEFGEFGLEDGHLDEFLLGHGGGTHPNFAIRNIVGNAGLGSEHHAIADADMVAESDLTTHDDIVAGAAAAGDADLRADEIMFPDGAIVTDHDLIIDFGPFTDSGWAVGASIDCGPGSDFDIIFDLDISHLGCSNVASLLLSVAESVGAEGGVGVDENTMTELGIRIKDDGGEEFAVIAEGAIVHDMDAAMDAASGTDAAVASDACAFGDPGVATDGGGGIDMGEAMDTGLWLRGGWSELGYQQFEDMMGLRGDDLSQVCIGDWFGGDDGGGMSAAEAVVVFRGIDESEFAILSILEWIGVVNDDVHGTNDRQSLPQVIGKGIDKRLKAHALAKTVRIHATTPEGQNPYSVCDRRWLLALNRNEGIFIEKGRSKQGKC